MTSEGPDRRALLDSVGVLSDESRWRLFSFIRRARRAVTREEAAATVGISRNLAAFHLDKMVAAGLLHARYEATGDAPRVGRRPKVYEPVAADISVSIPGRQYQLLADVLLETVLSEGGEETRVEAAVRAARARGCEVGAAWPPLVADVDDRPAIEAVTELLEEYGYEPVLDGDEVRLRNCPFHPLADRATDLVCGMNQAFVAGCLDAIRAEDLDAVLVPTPGECCVRLRRA